MSQKTSSWKKEKPRRKDATLKSAKTGFSTDDLVEARQKGRRELRKEEVSG